MTDKNKLLTSYAEEYLRTHMIKDPFIIRSFAYSASMAGYSYSGKMVREIPYKNSPVKAIINCEGLVYGVSGFAEAVRNLVYFLDKAKINTTIDPHDKVGADGLKVENTKKGMVINKLANVEYVGNKKKIRIVMNVPNGIKRRDPEEYLIAYIMFETQDFPKNFIASLKEQKVNEIWTPSQFNVDNIKKAGWKKPIFRMPLGVDTNRFNPDKVKPLDHTQSPIGYFKDKFIFLSIMGWSERKGVKRLMEAYIREFSIHENVILYIKGGWYDENKALLEYMVAKQKVNKKDSPMVYIDFSRYSDEMLPSLYKSANAFVLPSLGEGWGLNYTEAMSMGLPTIGTQSTSMVDFMTQINSFPIRIEKMATEPDCDWITPDYIGRKFAIPDIDSLRKQMRDVYSYRNGYLKQPEYARQDMLTKFTWEKASDKWIERLKEIAK